MNLINITNTELTQINGGSITLLSVASGVGLAVGFVAGVNAIGEAVDSFSNGHASFKH